MDGREFIRTVIAETLEGHLHLKKPVVIVMNLPALALEFTDAFRGMLGDSSKDLKPLPTVYCYCFSKGGCLKFKAVLVDCRSSSHFIYAIYLDDWSDHASYFLLFFRLCNFSPRCEIYKFPWLTNVIRRHRFLVLHSALIHAWRAVQLLATFLHYTVTDDKFEEDVTQRANDVLGLGNYITKDMCRRVRNVAPNKEMICIKFPLRADLLYRSTHSDVKRLKLNSAEDGIGD